MVRQPSADRTGDASDPDRLRPTRRQFVGAAGVSLAGLGVTGGATARRASQADRLTIVHDTHFHGRFGDEDGLNIARYRTVVEEQLAAHDNALFVGNGDDFAPSLLGLTYEGEHMVEVLNDFPIAANGVGNHEFDFGVETATQRFQESDFPWVVANLLTPDGEPIPGTERWTTVDADGLTVGFFGSGVGGFHGITDYPDDYIALDPVEAAAEATAALNDDGADIVVMLSHTGSDDHPDIAEAVDDLDLIVGSHSGRVFDEPKTVSGTVISEVGDEFNHVAVVTVDAAGGLVDWNRVDLTGDEALHADTWSLAKKWKDQLEEQLGQPHFTSGGILDSRFSTNYARESGLGNLITDVMREHLDGDVAVHNAGGIRSNTIYGPGPITGADVMNILPFPNSVVLLELTGEQLRDFLKSRVSALPWSDFGAQQAIQVSGLQYEWTGHGGEGSVENVYVDGEPLDLDGTYRFVTNDFVAANRDIVSEIEWEEETDELLGTLVLDALTERGHVEPTIEHRILRVDEDVGRADVTGARDTVTARFDLPDTVAGIYPHTFTAVTQWGHTVDAEDVSLSGDRVEVTFDADALRVAATGAGNIDLRLLGGFEPDAAAYGYEDDEGNHRDLPVAAGWPYFVLKVDLDAGAGPLKVETETESSASTPTPTTSPTPSPTPTAEPTASPTSSPTETPGQPGFGVLAGLVGAGAGAYLLRREEEAD